jgi:UDPglucose--hexose-1-phosphate uridylyltransferase
VAEVRIDPFTGLRTIVGDASLSADPADVAPEANRDLFWAGPAAGAHEVIDVPGGSLARLSAADTVAAVQGWRMRMQAHADAAYVHVFVDEGPDAESAAELYALDFVPAAIARERERFGAYATRTMGGNLLGDLVQEEVRRRQRVVAIDEESVLLSPFGARVPYQLMIAPRRPRMRFEDDGPSGGSMLHRALSLLARRFDGCPPFSLWVRTAPQGAEQFCWRIDVLPRLVATSGLELGVGVPVNPVTPEDAARELRDS